MKTTLKINQQEVQLYRFPLRSNEEFQAWNSADEYVLSHFLSLDTPTDKHILIINDSYGAISCVLNDYEKTVWSDSYTSIEAIKENLSVNNLSSNTITFIPMSENDIKNYDVVLIKVPKTKSLLEYQLSLLTRLINKDTQIIGYGMSKEIHTSTLQLFETYIGKTTTSLAKKKARLIFSTYSKVNYSEVTPTKFTLEGAQRTIINYPNVFAKDKLDIGTRLLIENLPDKDISSLMDLGCGSGVIALAASEKYMDAEIYGIDDSYLAVKSANETFKHNKKSNYSFYTSNAFDGYDGPKVDLILCNPPFHQDQKQSDHIAWKMFSSSKHHLNPNGMLIIVGNRHLNYHHKLKRIFNNCTVLNSNRKFVILQSKV